MKIKKISKLEKELEKILKDHVRPPNKPWIPYEKFMQDINKSKLKKDNPKLLDKINLQLNKATIQLNKDLEREQEVEHKQLLREIKKLSREVGKAKQNEKVIKAQQEKLIDKQVNNQKEINAFYDKKYTLDFNQKSYFSMKKLNGEIFNFEPTVHIDVNNDTVDTISDKVYELYTNLFNKFKKIYNQGFEIAVKLTFTDSSNDKNGIKSITCRQNPSLEDIKNKLLEKIVNKFVGGDSDYSAILNDLTIFVFPLSDKGGCATCKKNVGKFEYRDRTVKLISPKSSNDNCLFMCFAHFLDIKGNTLRFIDIRKELGINDGMISYIDVLKVADYFKCGFVLLDQQQKIIAHKDLINKPTVHIMLMNEHYYIVEYIDYFHCEHCGRKLLEGNKDHVCNKRGTTFYQSQRLKKREYVDMINCKDKKGKIVEDRMIFFDLETFQETVCHVPYACGYSIGDHKDVTISYGKDCMRGFIEHIIKQENKYICAYNGAGFDFYILINYLKDLNIPISNLILSNGRVLSFKFGKEGEENKVFDLYLFINTSLDKACKGYNIKNHKMKFDVLKIQSWELAEEYKQEVEPYLKYDVLSLSELFFCFNDSMYELDEVNITNYVTLSNMAYSLWQNSLTELIEIMDIEKYNFCKKATYGARCYPNQKEFKSKHYDDVINKKMTYEELIKTGDYINNGDATSLYPASMAGFELLDAQYPTNKSRWSDKPDDEFKNNKYGFYEINFTAPKDIVIPILPRKTKMGGLEWSLFDGIGVYTNVEIRNALSVGYKVEFIDKCLVWDTTSNNVFKPYVTKYYKMKEDAEKEGNKVKRAIAKLLLNAMYGKTLQRAIYENTAIINNYNELLDFFKNYEISDINVLSDSKLLLTGITLNKQEKITKPSQLGAFVLSYSRQIMMNYMKAIDPTLKTHVFTYTDTDSLHMLGNHAQKLREMGMIKPKNEASLGYLCSDIDDEGIIIYENNLAPKTYFYEYINNKNEVHDKDQGTFKGKGIPHKCLSYNMYNDYKESEQIVEFSGLRKKHLNLTKGDIKKGVNLFSIVNSTQTRTFMKSEWGGMTLIGNNYFPKGYINN
jgi:hypothetical protein